MQTNQAYTCKVIKINHAIKWCKWSNLINTNHANTLMLLYFDQQKTCKLIKKHANSLGTSLLQSKFKMQTYQNTVLEIQMILIWFISVICWYCPSIFELHACMIGALWLHEFCLFYFARLHDWCFVIAWSLFCFNLHGCMIGVLWSHNLCFV